MQNALFIAAAEDAINEASEEARPSVAVLVERHAQLVYRIALAVTRSPQDAEDVAQEAFLQLCRGDRWMHLENPQAYLARIAWRLAVRRAKPGRRSTETGLASHLEIASLEATPEQSAIDAQFEAHLHLAIDGLPEKLRQPLALAALGELKLVEVAAALGLPEGTVRRRIHSARQQLRKFLMEGGTR
jgi:RNA polymerase sigma-70 factor (ECF subfamily)